MFETLVWVWCLAVVSVAVSGSARDAGRIAGGEEVDIKDYPYQVSLETSGFHICGAAIISEEWAVTAADCAGGTVNSYTLRAGSSVRSSGGSVHQVVEKLTHPDFNGTINFDLALLRVSNTTLFVFGPRVNKIAMATQDQTTPAGLEATVTGWGASSSSGTVTSIVLQRIRVPVTGEQECKEVYGEVITDTLLCAGRPEGDSDSCQGDTGGPMVVEEILVGVVSRRTRCAQAGFPGLYSRIARMRDWIRDVTSIQ